MGHLAPTRDESFKANLPFLSRGGESKPEARRVLWPGFVTAVALPALGRASRARRAGRTALWGATRGLWASTGTACKWVHTRFIVKDSLNGRGDLLLHDPSKRASLLQPAVFVTD